MDKAPAPPASLAWAKDVPCRNITIHGFCRYEGKGCSFKHDTADKVSSNVFTPKTPVTNPNTSINAINSALSDLEVEEKKVEPVKKKFNPASSSVFTPSASSPSNVPALGKPAPIGSSLASNKFLSLSPKLQDIPSFVPSGFQTQDNGFDPQGFPAQQLQSPMGATQLPPLGQGPPGLTSQANPYLSHQAPSSISSISLPMPPPPQPNPYAAQSAQQSQQEPINPYMAPPQQDFMFHPQQQTAYPLQYHLYAPSAPPHLQIPLKANEQTAETLFIPNKLREALQRKNEATLAVMGNSGVLPDIVGVYFDLVPLDTALEKNTQSYGYTTAMYKAFSNSNGRAYALRRIENVHITMDKSLATVHHWMKLKHSNIAQVVDAFTTRSFGDNSLIVVYDYYPDAKSLFELHFGSNVYKPEPITSEGLWTYMTQIGAAIAAAHSKGLPVRSLNLHKVVLTSKNRVRLSGCGVSDILNYDNDATPEEIAELKARDLQQLGRMMILLASAKLSQQTRSKPDSELIECLEQDMDFKDALRFLLLTPPDSENYNITNFQFQIAPRLYKELDKIQHSADFYESQLARELENARLVRLMTKLNFILDRPEQTQSPQWQETGSRYPLKLFHSYVFHQVDEKGKPVLDLAHVLRTLNKLDAGIAEKLLLVSPDEQSCLIVSYKELKDLVEKSFRELSG